MEFIVKTILSAMVIAAISMISKRFTMLAAFLAALPTTTFMAVVFLYNDTKSIDKVVELCNSVFWMVLVGLVFMVSLPLLLKKGLNIYASIALALCLMMIAQFTFVKISTHRNNIEAAHTEIKNQN